MLWDTALRDGDTAVRQVVLHNRGRGQYELTSNGRCTPQQCQHLVTQLLLPLVSKEACAQVTVTVNRCRYGSMTVQCSTGSPSASFSTSLAYTLKDATCMSILVKAISWEGKGHLPCMSCLEGLPKGY